LHIGPQKPRKQTKPKPRLNRPLTPTFPPALSGANKPVCSKLDVQPPNKRSRGSTRTSSSYPNHLTSASFMPDLYNIPLPPATRRMRSLTSFGPAGKRSDNEESDQRSNSCCSTHSGTTKSSSPEKVEERIQQLCTGHIHFTLATPHPIKSLERRWVAQQF